MLDDKATPCIFVGYEDAEFGYKLWDPKKKLEVEMWFFMRMKILKILS
jgi:hypothetical protein